ncbi:MAG: hypothetical protein ACKV2V_15635 [Blastocatellia bacterium]
MKLMQLLICLILLPVSGLAQTRTFNRMVSFTPGGALRVNTDLGSVRLTAWDRDQVEIVAHIIGRTEQMGTEYAQRAVDATQIEVTGDAGALTIRANYDNVPREKRWGGWNRVLPRIEWEIRAPRRADIELDTGRSEAEVRGFEGRHRLKLDRSPLRAADLAGDTRLHIDRGGDSRLRGMRGGLSIEADRTNLTFDELRLTSDSRVQLDRGHLELGLAPGQGLHISARRERRTSFRSDLPLTLNPAIIGGDEDKIEGSINGGGPRLALQTDRAQVRLRGN